MSDCHADPMPHNRGAEMVLLGMLIQSNDQEAIEDILNIVRPDDFYQDAHRRIAKCIADLWNERRTIAYVHVFEQLKRQGWLEDIGGPVYLAEINEKWSEYPVTARATELASLIREHAVRRHLVASALSIAAEVRDGRPLDELADRFGKAAEAAGDCDEEDSTSIRDAVDAELARIDSVARGDTPSRIISTPFAGLNELTGGWQTGLYTIGARPGVGKTAFALACAQFAAVNGHHTVVISLEMRRVQLVQRSFAAGAGINLRRFRDPKPITSEEADRLGPAAAAIRDLPLRFHDKGSISTTQLSHFVRKCIRKYGSKIVFIDYLQLIEPTSQRATEYEQLRQISRDLKKISMTFDIPIVALAQLNRDIEKRENHRPRLSDLRGSGSIEQDSDEVYFLWSKDNNPNEDVWTIGLDVAKQRNGPPGDIELSFRRSVVRFEEKRYA